MTGDNTVYKYIDKAAPKLKIDYSYSKYGGEFFLNAYIDSRRSVLTNELPDSFSYIAFENDNATMQLFNYWIKQLLNKTEIDNTKLNLLIKRFEVTKKIYEDYDENYRPLDKSKYECYELYVMFSYVLVLSYSKRNKLQYLNSLLKVNDISISNIENLSIETKELLRFCLKRELEFISELRSRLNNND